VISEGPSVLRLADFVNGFPFKPDQLGNDGVPVVRIRQMLDEAADVQLAVPPSGAVWIQTGDLLFSWSATLAVRVWNRGPALLNQHLFRVDPKHGIERTWLSYVLQVGLDRLRPLMHGSAMTHITREMLRTLSVAVPPASEQRAIADYLDTETARIDALITKKRHLVELLDRARMSVMTEGVCGSLIGATQEPTSLAWMRSKGKGWREPKLNFVARLGTGHTPSRAHPEWWVDCTIPWVTTGEVAQMRSDRIEFINDTREAISLLGVANSSAMVHPAGTVVLCRTAASAGYSAIMRQDMATSQDIVTWTCGPMIRPRFLLLCLRAMRQDLLGRLAAGSTHKTIYMPEVESLRVPLPTIAEQDQIVDAVWSRLNLVHRAIDATERQIDLLVEHRQALITAAVTGELAVPSAAA
jgi:type I restriction enzyme S subunit